MTWRDKSCEHCVFRVGPICRRFPPHVFRYGKCTYPPVEMDKPYVKDHGDFAPACAEYAESLDKPLETITEEA